MVKKLPYALLADTTKKAKHIAQNLEKYYEFQDFDSSQFIIVIGGDGFMLRTLRTWHQYPKKFFGINAGRIGFLLNIFEDKALQQLKAYVEQSQEIIVNPLLIEAVDEENRTTQHFAFNEVALYRQDAQSLHLDIFIDNRLQIEDYIADGLLVATPMGSSAYNYSCYGPILPLDTNLCALTPISVRQPRRWRGALLNRTQKIAMYNKNTNKRPSCLSFRWANIKKYSIYSYL